MGVEQKTNFYAAEEYLQYQKTLLKKELKTQIRKHALIQVDQFRENPEAQYNLYYRQRVKKFFALSYRKVEVAAGEEQKVNKKAAKLP